MLVTIGAIWIWTRSTGDLVHHGWGRGRVGADYRKPEVLGTSVGQPLLLWAPLFYWAFQCTRKGDHFPEGRGPRLLCDWRVAAVIKCHGKKLLKASKTELIIKNLCSSFRSSGSRDIRMSSCVASSHHGLYKYSWRSSLTVSPHRRMTTNRVYIWSITSRQAPESGWLWSCAVISPICVTWLVRYTCLCQSTAHKTTPNCENTQEEQWHVRNGCLVCCINETNVISIQLHHHVLSTTLMYKKQLKNHRYQHSETHVISVKTIITRHCHSVAR